MIDLSLECFKTKHGRTLLKDGGKSYMSPMYDMSTGKVKILFGYCDDKPKIEEINITDIVCFAN